MTNRMHFKDYMREQLRHRFAPTSKLGVDNDIIINIMDSSSNDPEWVENLIENKGGLFNPNLKLLNIGLNEIDPYNILAEKYPPFVLKKGFASFMQEAGIPKGYYSNYFGGKSLKTKWKKLQNKNLNVVVIGYGGAMSNILFNLSLLADAFDHSVIFDSISIVEPDNWSLTNIMRVSKPIMHRAFSRYQLTTDTLKKLMIIDKEIELGEEGELIDGYLDADLIDQILEKNPDTIFIGAPNFETRKTLEEKGAHFIMIGHSGNRIRMTKNPVIHAGVEETYGTIDVPVLLCNLWVATYKLVELLQDPDAIRAAEPDHEFFEYDFDEVAPEKVELIKKDFMEER